MSKISTYTGESAVDICIRGYRNIEGLIDLCTANEMELDGEEVNGVERTIDDVRKKQLDAIRPTLSPKTTSTRRVFIESDQNIIDLALQETGSIDGLIALLQVNEYGCDTVPESGVELKLKGVPVVNEDVRSFYAGLNYKVNTGEGSEAINLNAINTEDGFAIVTEDGQTIEIE